MFRSASALPSLARPAFASSGRAPAAAICAAPSRFYHEKADPTVGTGLVGAPACGDVMKLQIKVDEATGKIVDARFKTFGCGSAIASSSLVTEMVRGLSLDEAAQIKNSTIASELSLPPVKLHCSMLAEDAIKAAISDFQKKRASMGATVAASASSAPAGASATA
ncbi:iron sulfur cluster assembly protein 1, mitochondrial [Allomyces macrogynus ATCC 38327]|uniref:Iron sulfur cluster assembly protein 1, mitochondrial n=1 Tax=Allomyces macrogynus (strain ATCC 38327) TaxID=578462 RepID=A0A0L0SZC2_ALLM3|nr:iron sulfur cluster assembly protein 1, mitochondrial [Allomyces macrogynus ATCC 38327]|eukprot:KNE67846.1 iron sulfur cluster assembly protein 1, mitochondrial [Allomyces macrogynus ATCC 38327]